MDHIEAIGFDLFNTLITIEKKTLKDANTGLISSLKRNDLLHDEDAFKKAYREAILSHLAASRKSGRETHNRFWISDALKSQGHDISPDAPAVSEAVEHYFSAFFVHCHLLPGTLEMLERLNKDFKLGLLSNFTHGPAGRKIIDVVGLGSFFDVILISGELGYRKPHRFVFDKLVEHLDVERNRIIYVGDDPESDVDGADQAGLNPVWTTYVRDQNISFEPGILSGPVNDPPEHVPRISEWKDLLALLR